MNISRHIIPHPPLPPTARPTQVKSNRRAAGMDMDDFDDDTTADGTVSTFGPLSPVVLASPLINQQDDHGNTALHIACSNKSIR